MPARKDRKTFIEELTKVNPEVKVLGNYVTAVFNDREDKRRAEFQGKHHEEAYLGRRDYL